jgi:hypothetical protein
LTNAKIDGRQDDDSIGTKTDLDIKEDQLTTVGNSNHSVKHMSSLEDDFSDIKSFGAYECGSLSSLSSGKIKQAQTQLCV